MDKDDLRVLMEFRNKLTGDMIDKFESFVNVSREQLNGIHQIMLNRAKGARATNLIKKQTGLEKELLKRLKALADKRSESSRIQGKIDSLLYEQQLVQTALKDSQAGKTQAENEIEKLKAQIPHYEAQIQACRDSHVEERERFSFFSWKVRDIHTDNGERIAQENLNRLLERIRHLQKMVENWSDVALNKRMAAILGELPKHKSEKNSSEHEYNNLKKRHDKVEKDFNATIDEIESIYRSVGTVDLQSIKMVDKIACAIQSGEDSLKTAYDSVRNYLNTIDVDKDLLVNSVIAALRFIHMTDEYLDAARIQTLKYQLDLE